VSVLATSLERETASRHAQSLSLKQRVVRCTFSTASGQNMPRPAEICSRETRLSLPPPRPPPVAACSLRRLDGCRIVDLVEWCKMYTTTVVGQQAGAGAAGQPAGGGAGIGFFIF